MASPLTVVKGDYCTRLTPARIIRCMRVQDQDLFDDPNGFCTSSVVQSCQLKEEALMSKTERIEARIEPELKQAAESVFAQNFSI